jgi:hypothetical protein
MPMLYINEKFVPYIPKNINYIIFGSQLKKTAKPHLAIFTFPCIHNIWMMVKLKWKYGTKIIYILHEPFYKWSDVKKAKYPKDIAVLQVASIVNLITTYLADIVVLPSQRALQAYKNGGLYFNRNYARLPLLYDDESRQDAAIVGRKYFSFIGGVYAAHAFEAFLVFVEEAIARNVLHEYQFLIATRSKLAKNDRLKKMEATGRLLIVEGKPLTQEEINYYYKSSLVVWNAYDFTNQSGVLAKSFMFGTPAIVLQRNLSEFVKGDQEVVAIQDNTSFKEIQGALLHILQSYESFSNAARQCFLDNFFYQKHNELMCNILNRLNKLNK